MLCVEHCTIWKKGQGQLGADYVASYVLPRWLSHGTIISCFKKTHCFANCFQLFKRPQIAPFIEDWLSVLEKGWKVTANTNDGTVSDTKMSESYVGESKSRARCVLADSDDHCQKAISCCSTWLIDSPWGFEVGIHVLMPFFVPGSSCVNRHEPAWNGSQIANTDDILTCSSRFDFHKECQKADMSR